MKKDLTPVVLIWLLSLVMTLCSIVVANAQMTSIFRATGSGAMSETYTIPTGSKKGLVSEIRVHLDSASATSENFIVYNNAAAGAAYDILLLSQDMDTVQDVVYIPVRCQHIVGAADVLTFTWANTNARTWGLELIFDDGR